MTRSLAASLETVDLVPAAEVWEVISATDREFASLERRAREAAREADDAEQRAREAGIDMLASTWAMVRLQWFLDDLRSEVDDQIDDHRELARQRAQRRIEEGKAEAYRIRAAVSVTPDFAPTWAVSSAPTLANGDTATDPGVAATTLAPVGPLNGATTEGEAALAREFWPEPKPAGRFRLRRIAVSAVLGVLVVLLAVVLTVLRLS